MARGRSSALGRNTDHIVGSRVATRKSKSNMKAKPQQADDSLDPRDLKRIRQRVRKWLKQPDASKLRELWPLDGGGFNYFAFHADILYYTRVNMEEIRRPLLDFEQLGVELSPREEAFFLRLRAHIHVGGGHPKKAEALYAMAWDSFGRLSDKYEQFRTAVGWVRCLADLGALDRIESLRKRVSRWRDLMPSTAVLRFDTNLAVAASRAGNYAKAASLHRAVEKRSLTLGLELEATIAAHNLGHSHLMAGDPQSARAVFQRNIPRAKRLNLETQLASAQVCLAQVDLLEGNWSDADRRLTELGEELSRRGGIPQALGAKKDLAVLLGNLGAERRAEQMAKELERECGRRGIAQTQLALMMLRAKLLRRMGRPREALGVISGLRKRLNENVESDLARETKLESAQLYIHMEQSDLAGEVLRALISDPDNSTFSTALYLLATSEYMSGNFKKATNDALRAYSEAKYYPASLDRPAISMLLAELLARQARNDQARKWMQRCIRELQQHHAAIESSSLRGSAASQATNLYQRALELNLDLGGRGAVSRAVDLLGRSRSMPLLELMLRGAEFPRRGKLARLLRQRDRWSEEGAGVEDEAPLMREVSREMDLAFRSAPRQVRALMKQMEFRSWRTSIRREQVALYDARASKLRIFVVRGRQAPQLIELGSVMSDVARLWGQFSLLVESLAGSTPDVRRRLMDRSTVDATELLARIRALLLDPLPHRSRTVLIPDGLLHEIPLEAIAELDGSTIEGAIRRLPHPALLGMKRANRRNTALLIHDGEPGRVKEVSAIARMLKPYGIHCRKASTKSSLRRALSLAPGIVHIAAHGRHSERSWLNNGLLLADGWIGFEEFRGGSLRDALVYMSSCESGLLRGEGSRTMAGWMATLFGAGATETLLTLWKIDDQSAALFARSFYQHWLDGKSAREAASRARNNVRAENPHPFSWASFFAVG